MPLGVFNVLNATTMSQKLPQRRFAFHIGPAPQIVTVEHQKIKSAGSRVLIINSAVEGFENRHPFEIKPNNFSIKNCRALDLCRRLDNPGISLRPVRAVDRVEAYSSIATPSASGIRST